MTGMQPPHPWHDCNGCIEFIAYYESGGAGLLGALTKTPCTGMLTPGQYSPTTRFSRRQFKTTSLSCHSETFFVFQLKVQHSDLRIILLDSPRY